MGPILPGSVAKAWTAERAPEEAPEISFVLVKEAEMGGGYAVLLDWRAVPLRAVRNGEDGTRLEEEAIAKSPHLRGYKVSEGRRRHDL
jgi:hypothetical protein